MDVFLVTVTADGNSWRCLAVEPTYYGTVMVSGARPSDDEALFAASSRGDRCRIEWATASRPSSLRGGVERLDLGHGETFDVDGRTYLVYVQPEAIEWSESAPGPLPPASGDALERLRLLPPGELAAAASRFLALPHVLAWWEREFVTRTGFEQPRDGRVPAVRTCELALREGGAHLAWEVQVWSPLRRTWTDASARASFARDASAEDLLLLHDCATRLSVLASGAGDRPRPASGLLRKVGWATVALSLLLAFTLAPVCFALGSQELAITTLLFRHRLLDKYGQPTAFSAGEGQVDPWGRAWRFKPRPAEQDPGEDPASWRWGFYSVGPDGEDDAGLGDDAWGYEMAYTHPECRALAVSREGFLLLAFTLTWFLAHPWRAAPRSPSKRREAARSLVIAAPPALVALAVGLWASTWIGGHAGQLARSAGKNLLAPLPLAASLSLYLLLFALVLAFRLRSPLAPAERASL